MHNGLPYGHVILKILTDKLYKMEQRNKIQRSEEWQKIYEIVKQLPIKNESRCDAMDAPSAATEIENLFLKLLAIRRVRVCLFNFIARYLPIQWWAYDGMGGRDRWNKTNWKYVITGKHRKQRLKLGWA